MIEVTFNNYYVFPDRRIKACPKNIFKTETAYCIKPNRNFKQKLKNIKEKHEKMLKILNNKNMTNLRSDKIMVLLLKTFKDNYGEQRL